MRTREKENESACLARSKQAVRVLDKILNIEYGTRNSESRRQILRFAQNDKNKVYEWDTGLPIIQAVAYVTINL